MSSRVVLPVLIVAVGSLAALNQIRTSGQPPLRWLALAGVALALALVFRQLDVAGRFSSPDSWLQGHALWHILTSASLGGMYLYHRLEYRQPGLHPPKCCPSGKVAEMKYTENPVLSCP